MARLLVVTVEEAWAEQLWEELRTLHIPTHQRLDPEWEWEEELERLRLHQSHLAY